MIFIVEFIVEILLFLKFYCKNWGAFYNDSMRKQWIIGIDEVGRGPLAGPLTVAAVAATVISNNQFLKFVPSANSGALPVKHQDVDFQLKQTSRFKYLKHIKNSKKLSPLKREKWNKKIRDHYQYAIASVGPGVIDRIGISKAAKIAVARCLRKIASRPPACRSGRLPTSRYSIVLDGGLYAPKKYQFQQTLIKGDERHPVIAAASIVAKVYRDRMMIRLAKKFPLYQFDRHKGYGTKAHQEAIRRHGLSSVHRRSFCGNIKTW
jgi:ribonuclease HII